ncbi:MAG: serine protease [Bdellovibrionales bacterium RIFOXYD1_FULL_53_11]|nr:MAG: serine protease [Bdellovibrionales bacterium RIFOXYD1_FULL_53_11]
MNSERLTLYKELEEKRQSRLLVFVTGDRPGLETQIHSEVLDFFSDHLDAYNGKLPKISLLLYTRGGNTLAAWGIVNLIRQFCHEFEVIVPSKAHSAGTLICLGADSILMTKQATLGPIDPSVNTPLNPQIVGGPPHARYPVSVEAIKGYIELSKKELGIKAGKDFSNILIDLANKVHPLVLGEVYRAREQIRELAKNLLSRQVKDKRKIENIISFLCSDSGSHDYLINRREARDKLGLKIDKPNDELYGLLKKIYLNIRDEMELNNKYDPNTVIGADKEKKYSFKRVIIESTINGTDAFISEGVIKKVQINTGPMVQEAIQDQRVFEGWRHLSE